MYCPKCGKQQSSDEVRFCTKCGLTLESAARLLTAGSVPTIVEKRQGGGQLSPRAKGILQGIAIAPAAIGAWLVLDIFYEGVFHAGMLGGLYAMFTLVVLTALARILYAIIFEEGSRKPTADLPSHTQSELDVPMNKALPDTTAAVTEGFGPRDGAVREMIEPRSVTENTKQKLTTSE